MILWKRRPDNSKDVTAWNQERNKIALKIQEEVIDELWEEEKNIAVKLNIKPPKRSASLTGTVTGRYDKLAEKKKSYSDSKLKAQMSNYLIQKPSESSSSSLSSSSSSSSPFKFCRVNQK